MKRVMLTLAMGAIVAVSCWASTFVNTYSIVAKLENGTEIPYQGTISITCEKNREGMVEYKRLTIYVNEMLNYEWNIHSKTLVNETTVDMTDFFRTTHLIMSQLNDSVFVFELPMFFGDRQAKVKYKAIQQKAAGSRTEAEAAIAMAAMEEAKRQKAAGAMAGLFGGGTGIQGNPMGKGCGSVGGNQWSVAGRDVKSLPKPDSSFNKEGTVVVSITVDANGKVISARAIGGTVSDRTMRALAEEAAQKAVFSTGSSEVRGTITYTFRFN